LGNGLHEAGTAGVVAERLARLDDALHHGIVGDRRIRPEILDQIFLGDEVGPPLDQVDEHLERLGPQVVLPAFAPQAALRHINFTAANPIDGFRRTAHYSLFSAGHGKDRGNFVFPSLLAGVRAARLVPMNIAQIRHARGAPPRSQPASSLSRQVKSRSIPMFKISLLRRLLIVVGVAAVCGSAARAQGTIKTVAGTGTAGFSGDGGLATSATIYFATDVAVDSAGNLYIADYDNNRIRKVNTSGIITTVAGSGNIGFSGDNGPATSASFRDPRYVAVDSAG